MYTHSGTHMDAPAHIFKSGLTLDQYNSEYFVGKAIILDMIDIENATIDLKSLVPFENSIKNMDYLIFNTGKSKHWGTDKYFVEYPVLTCEAAQWLVDSFGLKGIGVDAISIDKEGDSLLPIHHIFLKQGKVIIENLTNLDQMKEAHFTFSCLPLKIKDADGSPIRAIAILD